MPKIYCFVEKFDNKELQTINKSTGIIYRNYEKKVDEKEIIAIKQHCKKNKKKIFLANNLKIASQLKSDEGLYVAAFYISIEYQRSHDAFKICYYWFCS